MKTSSVLWFRLDLRLDDNPALLAAIRAGNVVPVFIWSPEEEAPWPPGAASRWWLHHSLVELQRSLAACGSQLIFRTGPSLEAIRQLVEETGATSVFWNRRYEPAAIVRDTHVKQQLRESGIVVETFNSALLFEPWTIRTKSKGGPFQVFSAFWKTCLSQPEPAAPVEAPAVIPAPASWPASLSLQDLQLEPAIDWAAGFRDVWDTGEAAALERVKTADLNHYATDRDFPAREGTSRLSPHLHFGEISSRRVWHALRTNEEYLRQLGWREFAHHLLYHFPHTANRPLRAEFANFPWRDDTKMLRAWQRGQTGFPLVDAGMHELWSTGWMHNRVRMVAASFLTKQLQINWEEGAYWFWDTLVDADLANNTLGWQWSSGCGADAAPYFRIFNPQKQQERFDPYGDYVRRWAPHKLPPMVDLAAARKDALASFEEMKERGFKV